MAELTNLLDSFGTKLNHLESVKLGDRVEYLHRKNGEIYSAIVLPIQPREPAGPNQYRIMIQHSRDPDFTTPEFVGRAAVDVSISDLFPEKTLSLLNEGSAPIQAQMQQCLREITLLLDLIRKRGLNTAQTATVKLQIAHLITGHLQAQAP